MSERKVRQRDLDTLQEIDALVAGGFDGMGAYTLGLRSHLKRLERMGLVRYVGHGAVEADGANEYSEYPIYELTAQGRAATSAAGEDKE